MNKTISLKTIVRFLFLTLIFLVFYSFPNPISAQGASCDQITLAAVGFQGMTSGTVGVTVKAEAAQHGTRTCDNWTGQCTMTVVNQSTGEIACGVEDLNCGTSSVSCPAGGKKFNVSIVTEPVGYNCRLNIDHVCLANASDNGAVEVYCDPEPRPTTTSPTPVTTSPTPVTTSPTPVSPPTPGTPRCTVSQSCTRLTCSFNTTYYNGSETLTDYKTKLKPNKNATLESDWQTTETPSHIYEAGTYTAQLKARENDDTNESGWCETSAFTVSSTTTTTATPTPTPTPTTSLYCMWCQQDAQAPKWTDDNNCSNTSVFGNCTRTCISKDANMGPERLGNRCWTQIDPPTPEGYIYGRYLVTNDRNNPASAVPISDTNILPVYWWNYRTGVHFPNQCIMSGYYNLDGTDVPLCLQTVYYDVPSPGGSCTFTSECPIHYVGNAGQPDSTNASLDKHVSLNVWSQEYTPIGYYQFQEVRGENCRPVCGDTNVSGNRCRDYNCIDCGGTLCVDADCSNQCDGVCRRKTTPTYSTLGYTPLNPTTDITRNPIAYYCLPPDLPARLDIVFARNRPMVSGTVSIDTDGDNTCDTGYDGSGGSANAILRLDNSSGNVVDVESANSSGNYMFNQGLQFNQQYWAGLALPVGYQLISANPSSQNATPTSGNSNPRVDFCIRELPADPWWQVRDADLQANGNISSNIPIQCVRNPNQCTARFDLDGQGGFPGIPAASGTTGFGQGRVSTKGWDVEGSGYTGRRYDYDWFAKKAPAETFTTGAISSNTSGGDNLVAGYNGPTGHIWRYKEGDLTLNQTSNLGTRKVILFVNGNLTIQNRITLTRGSGFFAAIVRGNINVDPSVDYTGQAPPNSNSPGIEGFYMANGTISTSTGGAQSDRALFVRGGLISWGGINLERNLGTSNNRTNPAEFIEYAPDLVFTFPRDLMREGLLWQEIAP